MVAHDILVPVDFSKCSELALQTADAMAIERDARLFLLHVHPIVDIPVMDFSYAQPTEHTEALRDALQAQLAKWAQRLRTPAAQVVHKVVVGAPVDEIIQRSKDFDLIVLGTHGRSGMSHFLLGSVAERVVQGAHCSVFVAKQRNASGQ